VDSRRPEQSARPLRERLGAGPPLLLDGATGTELERRGVRTGLPLWSTHALLEAPETLRAVHADYARAGAEVITANTFRTQGRTLLRAEPGLALAERDATLTAQAVALARQGVLDAGSGAWIAGSAPTLEDCYRPDLVPDPACLTAEHARHVANLVAAGVDLILVETMNSIREALAAGEAAAASGLPFVISFVSWRDARLLSGEGLAEAIEAVRTLSPLAVGVNCLPPSAVPPCLDVLRRAALPFGVYANLGEPEDETGFARSEDCPPARFASIAASWRDAGARFVGGCCGTTPAHIRATAERFKDPLGPATSP
jgi:S-methylmethionine-dependent homocysteine/selenocysteine methylase